MPTAFCRPLKLDNPPRHLILITTLLLVPVLTLLTLSFNAHRLNRLSFSCSSRTAPQHGGDCEAIGEPRRPSWACTQNMKDAIPEFISLYNSRPIQNNFGGVLFDHAFALWYTLRMEQPKIVIESGAFKGLTTWLIREALPAARIISIDPANRARTLRGVEYMTGNNFTDFASIDWAAKGVNAQDTIVFLDDHQSAFRRIFAENKHSFTRFIVEDNYDYLKGDNMSLKWVCERSRKSLWQGTVRDNFGKNKTSQSWEQHLELGERLNSSFRTYYEFPPLASSSMTGQTRYDELHSTPAIVTDRAFFDKHLSRFDKRQFAGYTHLCFAELLAAT
ncbi:hypothetical protein BWQ96_02544 [Gracilariopsis chorda]|uniref:Uncharacterized protein n=1 Tax=Gracilariopsis chorda TaxID=448386 RepID=A0A2V3IZU5_9FLOR|nr:hypothetical protein BWQ96_02544 [Gracilariopsis chorda]|eukprot:PXF47682.1 hypothetical protein BWQ96_02544 [Gracilariopsis chorda]